MEWFGARLPGLRWLRRREHSGSGAVALACATESGPATAEGPPLVLLIPDAAGLASLRLETFPDVEPAAAYIAYWFPTPGRHGIVAFWALHDQPQNEPGAEWVPEAVVLIRDALRPGVVYPFSFVDMESAQLFVRGEVGQGLGLEFVLIYWAAPVSIATDDWGRIRLAPAIAPRGDRRQQEAPPPQTVQPHRLWLDDLESILHPVKDEPESDAEADTAWWEAAVAEIETDVAALRSDSDSGVSEGCAPEEEAEQREDEHNDADTPEGGSIFPEDWQALQKRRWEERDGPFTGFHSPPGKF